jgi:hypothetical protein
MSCHTRCVQNRLVTQPADPYSTFMPMKDHVDGCTRLISHFKRLCRCQVDGHRGVIAFSCGKRQPHQLLADVHGCCRCHMRRISGSTGHVRLRLAFCFWAYMVICLLRRRWLICCGYRRWFLAACAAVLLQQALQSVRMVVRERQRPVGHVRRRCNPGLPWHHSRAPGSGAAADQSGPDCASARLCV